MEQKYRRVTAEELARIGYVPNKTKYNEHIAFANKYYPPEAHTMTLVINSEYNDSTYDNRLKYVIVHDQDGNEVPPIKKTARECRDKWEDLSIPGSYNGHYSTFESNEEMDDVVIILSDKLPEFYVKEN